MSTKSPYRSAPASNRQLRNGHRFSGLCGLDSADTGGLRLNVRRNTQAVMREGLQHLNDRGSITLTSGALAHSPIPGSAAISAVNTGVEGFVRAAALELPRGQRINVASPIFVTETAIAMGMDPSNTPSATTTASVYLASVEGEMTGQILDTRDYA
ncbi:SDR family oxidoreductase [Paraburkholderia sp. SIMBA_050]